jgi:hypothetical protein
MPDAELGSLAGEELSALGISLERLVNQLK